jgi:hypothetical protein
MSAGGGGTRIPVLLIPRTGRAAYRIRIVTIHAPENTIKLYVSFAVVTLPVALILLGYLAEGGLFDVHEAMVAGTQSRRNRIYGETLDMRLSKSSLSA